MIAISELFSGYSIYNEHLQMDKVFGSQYSDSLWYHKWVPCYIFGDFSCMHTEQQIGEKDL